MLAWITASVCLIVAIAIVVVVKKLANAKNVMLIGRVDSQRARAQAAERVAFRVTDVADKAVTVALEIQAVSGKVDELLEHVTGEPKRGKHELRVVRDGQEGAA